MKMPKILKNPLYIPRENTKARPLCQYQSSKNFLETQSFSVGLMYNTVVSFSIGRKRYSIISPTCN